MMPYGSYNAIMRRHYRCMVEMFSDRGRAGTRAAPVLKRGRNRARGRNRLARYIRTPPDGIATLIRT